MCALRTEPPIDPGSCACPLAGRAQPDELVRVAFDSLRERICVLDRDGRIVLTNAAWDRFAHQNGASPDRCGPGVNYLEVCRSAHGPFSERASEAALGIDSVLHGAVPQFSLIYPCPSPWRKAWFRLAARPPRRFRNGAVILHSEITSQVLLAEKLRHFLGIRPDAAMRNREELEALTARLFREQEEERRRVAAELNGGLSQRVAALTLQAAHLAARAAAPGQSYAFEECVASLGHDLRHLSGDLYPALLDRFGLAAALRDCCTEFTRKQRIPVNYVHRGISARLPVQAASTLYRIAAEALANVAKHARARRTWVTLSRTAQGLRLAIRDDGAGFHPAAVEPGSGLGILAMRERLRAVSGSLSIRSRPGGGTKVVALVPLSSAGDQPRAAIPGDIVVDPLDQH